MICFWTSPQHFKRKCEQIEFELFKSYNSKKVMTIQCLKSNKDISYLKKQVTSCPNQRCNSFFLPKLGMTLSEFAMYDTLLDYETHC